ncbi:hypothetical protein Y032_0154g2986 [Ancylostoma ceylanicum]|uniref:Uncharacterized protein n=1 Tax=Ancylostoma ceylanicum TaxID=53326 RepID=A0A016SZ44_9BILA|nr:hypothetical protein Y032_0154g2986 [Ancylostoma ceylanicum]
MVRYFVFLTSKQRLNRARRSLLTCISRSCFLPVFRHELHTAASEAWISADPVPQHSSPQQRGAEAEQSLGAH